MELRDATALTAKERNCCSAGFCRPTALTRPPMRLSSFPASWAASSPTPKAATRWRSSDAQWYVSAWTTGASIKALKLTDAERTGQTGRIRATGLLRTLRSHRCSLVLSPMTNLCRCYVACAATQMRCSSSPMTGGCPLPKTPARLPKRLSNISGSGTAQTGQRRPRASSAGGTQHGRAHCPVLHRSARRPG